MKRMMSFKEAVRLEKKYVCVKYDTETQIKLRQWCIENGFDLSVGFDGTEQDPDEFDFHTTIFFTTSMHEEYMNGEFHINRIIPTDQGEAFITGFEYLGVEMNIPTFKVDSGVLRGIRDYFEQMGFVDAWDEWKPHVSISYAGKHGGVIPHPAAHHPEFPLTFTHFEVEKQREF